MREVEQLWACGLEIGLLYSDTIFFRSEFEPRGHVLNSLKMNALIYNSSKNVIDIKSSEGCVMV